jgi:hypothetical protein
MKKRVLPLDLAWREGGSRFHFDCLQVNYGWKAVLRKSSGKRFRKPCAFKILAGAGE